MSPEELVRKEILAMSAYPVADPEGMVKLDAMENPYPLPDALRRQLGEVLAGVAMNRYPTPTPQKLLDALARRMDVPHGMRLLLGNGSDELLQIVITALQTWRHLVGVAKFKAPQGRSIATALAAAHGGAKPFGIE